MKHYFYLAILIWNCLVFMTYGLDKRKARKGLWRISEKMLILMSLGLGGLGAWCGGQYFHHKSQKWYFKLTWYTGLMILGLACYLIWHSPF